MIKGIAYHRDDKLGWQWQSNPIRSHVGGYKLMLCANTVSKERGPVMDVYLSYPRMNLSPLNPDVPATFSITLQLLNQLADGNHFTRTFQFTLKYQSMAPATSESYEFIDYNELYREDKEVQYVMNDSFKLRMWLQLMLDSQ